MKILWKQLIIAGVGGYLSGQLVVIAKRNSDVTLPLLGFTATFTTVGVVAGVGWAYYKKVPLHVYGISAGANFGVAAFTFYGLRRVLKEKLLSSPTSGPKRKKLESWEGYMVSGGSGSAVGLLSSIISRHSGVIVLGTGVGGLVVGVVGQFVHMMVENWRIRAAVRYHHPELLEKKWTLKNFEAWFLGFWRSTNKATSMEMHIMVVQEDINSTKKAIAALDKELEKLDVKPDVAEKVT